MHMNREELTEIIVLAKQAKSLTWEAIADDLGVGKVWLTSACLGMNSMPEAPADKLSALLQLPPEAKATLMSYPTKTWGWDVPQDPLIYRLYEIVGVYGDTLKEVIQEQFGDGIMSAIDFSMDVDKEENPKGDRVVITMNGKFLPYKSW
jgi:cyanate lyase